MSRFERAVVWSANAVLFTRVFAYAWVTDDAFITFRVVRQLLAGNGPVYNAGERVQAFTHPLWFGALSLGGALDSNLYFWSIALGLGCTAAFQWVLYRFYCRTDQLWPYAIVLLGLALSESFLSFQTSGLENALTNALLAAFLFVYWYRATLPNALSKGLVLASLILLNRLDQVFLVVLPLGHLLLEAKLPWRALAVRVLRTTWPLLAWQSFAVVYYGFLFPNPRYAKLGGRSLAASARHGLRYTAEFVQTELHWVALLVLMVAATALLVRRRPDTLRPIAVLLGGIALQGAYVVLVGGCFMRGRFFTSIIAATAIAALVFPVRIAANRLWRPALTAVFLGLGVLAGYWAFSETLPVRFPGIENERNVYKKTLALNRNPWHNYTRSISAIKSVVRFRSGEKRRYQYGADGQFAYYADLDTVLIDYVGLSDAFIARLPVVHAGRTGHFGREIPAEYLTERETGQRVDGWADPAAEALWRRIERITRSERYFSLDRIRAMLWVWCHHGL